MNYTQLYLSDLKEIQNSIPKVNELENTRILITGAGGMICSAMVDFLMILNETQHLNIHVYAAARNKDKIYKRFSRFINNEHFHYVYYDATKNCDMNEKYDYLIHGASNANPASYVQQPVETMLANFVGIKNILDYARECKAKRVLYISSSEVYGKKDDCTAYKESDYEFVDILNARACYPCSKRASETMCVAYEKEYGVDSVIVRPGHIYGPTMTESDNRASSQFPRDVLEGHDIIMKSMGTQLRSYCYVLDCVSAIFTVLLNGVSGNAYNISNRRSIATIREIAEAFAAAADRKVVFELPSDVERQGYNMMDNSSLTSDKLEELGWKAIFDLKTGVEHTLECLES